MCPDGDGAEQKLEYTWVNGATRHIHKVLQIFLYSRTSLHNAYPRDKVRERVMTSQVSVRFFKSEKTYFTGESV